MLIVASVFAYIQEWGNPLTAVLFYSASPIFRDFPWILEIIPGHTKVLGVVAYTGFIVLSLGMILPVSLRETKAWRTIKDPYLRRGLRWIKGRYL